jgi:hypothetical protein
VPTEMLSDTYKGTPCSGTISMLGSQYTGVCLSDCLSIQGGDMLSKDGCASGQLCVPCTDPLSGQPTGAPGC